MGNKDKQAPTNADSEGRATGPNADEANTVEKLAAQARGEVVEPGSGGNTPSHEEVDQEKDEERREAEIAQIEDPPKEKK